MWVHSLLSPAPGTGLGGQAQAHCLLRLRFSVTLHIPIQSQGALCDAEAGAMCHMCAQQEGPSWEWSFWFSVSIFLLTGEKGSMFSLNARKDVKDWCSSFFPQAMLDSSEKSQTIWELNMAETTGRGDSNDCTYNNRINIFLLLQLVDNLAQIISSNLMDANNPWACLAGDKAE